jgi:hypothetical protein
LIPVTHIERKNNNKKKNTRREARGVLSVDGRERECLDEFLLHLYAETNKQTHKQKEKENACFISS